MLCSFCEGLSIEHLVELTAVEYRGGRFPDRAFYQHHATIEDLVESADNGCDFCRFIVACAEAMPSTRNFDETHSFLAFCQECEMRSTDVKIAIHAHHTNEDQTIEEVKLLDTLQIWFGPNPPYGYQEMEDYCHLEWPLDLTISVPRERPLTVSNHRIGRNQLDPVLDSDINFDVARSWFATCCNEHSSCPPRSIKKLPTRLVDVGEAPSWNVRLMQCQGQWGEYVALSHCWGGPIKLTLKLDNISEFLSSIPVSDLPANFRDAITITRKMGMRYIWIDSLCIIQDSDEDWAVESARMTDLYLNAAFTICAARSNASDCGILNQPRPAQKGIIKNFPIPPQGHIRVFPRSNPDATTVALRVYRPVMGHGETYHGWDAEDETMRGVEFWGALSKRAWGLQEKILSPRRLVYGRQQIYWICVEGCQSSDGLPDCFLTATDLEYQPLMRHFHTPGLQDPAILSAREIRKIQENYYDMVSIIYTARKLTYPSDKLPAFAGLARKFHPLFGGTYLAGVWSHDIHRGITWYNADGPWPHTPARPYRAPSWSWACADTGISFMFECSNADRVCPCIEYSRLEPIGYDVDYCDKSNPYGQIKSASLSVRGRTRILYRFRPSFSRIHEEEASKTVSVMSWFDDNNMMPAKFEIAYVEGRKSLIWSLPEEPVAEESDWRVYPSAPEKEFTILVVEASHGCLPRSHTEVLPDNVSVTSASMSSEEENEAATVTSVSTEGNMETLRRFSTSGTISSSMNSLESDSTNPESWVDGDTDSQNGGFWTDGEEELADSGLDFLEHGDEDVAGSQTDGGGGQEENEVRIECLILERDLDRDDIAYVKVGVVSIFEPLRFLEDWEVNTLTLI
ncbi:hypothetical protein MCOR25_010157 [Pyricularia grisea]|uniref:Heterokaryon incompatibility domain-containing protein n=1 Tax=Pyricularia grisea TaxID=148305 RepID=A0A6P8B892_PYRGI|nr:uncharacterized protein PgNI_03357 [Pyricularia grisea]KAI6351085.1 hypothetical protein MCOR25_010157 [Pyricularia grisea]TLD12070.1 hypothetical protein PgNI_03357 [Pyricularia grisea]